MSVKVSGFQKLQMTT